MKVKITAPEGWSNGTSAIFPIGCVIETDNEVGNKIIADGKGVQVPDNTACRLNPEGFDGCMPPPAPPPLAPRAAQLKSAAQTT